MSTTDARIASQSDEAIQYVGQHAQNITLDTVQTLTPPAGASILVIQAVDGVVRYTLDGESDPNVGFGFRISEQSPEPTFISTQEEVRVIAEAITAPVTKIEYQWAY